MWFPGLLCDLPSQGLKTVICFSWENLKQSIKKSCDLNTTSLNSKQDDTGSLQGEEERGLGLSSIPLISRCEPASGRLSVEHKAPW